ncbi:MAG: hypothetical protein RR846_00780 [Oscillospiraceae bacterium]
MISVAIVSPQLSLGPINHVIETHDFGCEFHRYVYKQLSDIEWIYEDCKNCCDVIFFSGELGYHYILNHIPNIKIPCSFIYYDTKHILSILLNFVMEHPETPLQRILVDFLTPLNNFMGLKSYLNPEFLPYCYESYTYDYAHITKRSLELWQEGKIDLVLTRSINNIPTLEKLGIPYISLFPTDEMISESIDAAVNEVRLAMASSCDHMTAIVKLVLEQSISGADREYVDATMHKLLVDFRREKHLDFSISPSFDRFELHLQTATVEDVPVQLQELVLYLKKHFGFTFCIGAGISASSDNSHYYAELALLETLKYGKNDGFLVSGEDASLTGPLSLSTDLTYNYSSKKTAEYAKLYGIDQSNLVKIIGLFRLEPTIVLTAAVLSKWLNITIRSCNRILQQLLDSQLIHEVAPQGPNRKGRPEKEYRFCAEQMRGELF